MLVKKGCAGLPPWTLICVAPEEAQENLGWGAPSPPAQGLFSVLFEKLGEGLGKESYEIFLLLRQGFLHFKV